MVKEDEYEVPLMVGVPARLEAIDYPNDLALLQANPEEPLESPDDYIAVEGEWSPPEGLELSQAPRPGDEILMCGFPWHVDSPRLVRGLVSGYHSSETYEGWSVVSVVLDATVHLGNSGGPICNLEGAVVGVMRAVPNPLPLDVTGLRKADRETAQRIAQSLRADMGMGFAIHPSRVQDLLDARDEWRRKRIVTAERFPPLPIKMTRSEFIDLQMRFARANPRPKNASPIGAFSVDETWRPCLGWSPDEDRVPIDVNDAWLRVLSQLQGRRGSFFLRGYDVLQYQRGAHAPHFIVPVTIQLSTD